MPINMDEIHKKRVKEAHAKKKAEEVTKPSAATPIPTPNSKGLPSTGPKRDDKGTVIWTR